MSVATPRQTDDLGNYRIYGLPPGRYVVRVREHVWRASLPEDTGVSFARTFHPSTTSAASAIAITLAAGQEQGGVNVRRIATRPSRVTGTVVDADGAPCPRAIVLLSEMAFGPYGASTAVTRNATDQFGRFVFSEVMSGDYSLVASPSESSSAVSRRGVASVAVAGADVEGVVVTLHEGARLSGRIEFEGGAPASTAGVRISAPDTVLAGSYGSAGVGSIADDWSFELTNVWPGERVIRLNGLLVGLFVESGVHGRRGRHRHASRIL